MNHLVYPVTYNENLDGIKLTIIDLRYVIDNFSEDLTNPTYRRILFIH